MARLSRVAVPANPPARCPIHEGARDMARDLALTDAYATSRREREKIEMLFAHLERILKLDRLRMRGPNGAKGEFLLAATIQNLRKLERAGRPRRRPPQRLHPHRLCGHRAGRGAAATPLTRGPELAVGRICCIATWRLTGRKLTSTRMETR
jgi:hypothetical protein